MDTEELTQAYVDDAFDKLVLAELFTFLPLTDLNSNAYNIETENEDGVVEMTTITFKKFVTEIDTVDMPIGDAVESFAKQVEEQIYNTFEENAQEIEYRAGGFYAVKNAVEVYEQLNKGTPDTVVLNDGFLDGEEITGIEAMKDVDVYESELLDIEGEILVSNSNKFGYHAVRTEPDVRSYIASDWQPDMEEDVVTFEDPLVIQAFTRMDTVPVKPSHGIRFVEGK